jgi:hypothetical protein
VEVPLERLPSGNKRDAHELGGGKSHKSLQIQDCNVVKIRSSDLGGLTGKLAEVRS